MCPVKRVPRESRVLLILTSFANGMDLLGRLSTARLLSFWGPFYKLGGLVTADVFKFLPVCVMSSKSVNLLNFETNNRVAF